MKNTILKGIYEGVNRYIIEYEEMEPKEKKKAIANITRELEAVMYP